MSEPKLRVKSSGMGGSGYRIPTWLDDTGKPMVVPGVTTVTGVTAKPGIVQWAVDNTAAFAVANIDALLSRTEEQGFGFLRWYHKRQPDLTDPTTDALRGHHVGVLNDAAELGTNMHEYIEADLKDDFLPPIDSPEMEEMVAEWLWWKSEHRVKPIAIEATVVNTDAKYAGTLDGIVQITCLHDNPCVVGENVPVLWDAKTSRNTWPEHGEQAAALGACNVMMVEVAEGQEGAVKHESTVSGLKQVSWWVEDAVPAFSEYRILHLRPTDYDNNGVRMEPFCRLEKLEDLDLHYESFLGSLIKKQMELKIKERVKARTAQGKVEDW